MNEGQGVGAPVNYYMSEPVHWVEPDDDLARVQELLGRHHVAGLAVVDSDAGELSGVITRTDILRVGSLDARVADHMTRDVLTVRVDQGVCAAATGMVANNVHRVFVAGGEGLVGVLSTTDLVGAVRDLRVDDRVASYMTTPVVSIDVREPLSAAMELIEHASPAGLVVREGVWPVGLFGPMEALESRELDPDWSVEHVMSQHMITIPAPMPMFRVAGQAAALGVRRAVVMEHGAIVGVVTGMDFARACAEASHH